MHIWPSTAVVLNLATLLLLPEWRATCLKQIYHSCNILPQCIQFVNLQDILCHRYCKWQLYSNTLDSVLLKQTLFIEFNFKKHVLKHLTSVYNLWKKFPTDVIVFWWVVVSPVRFSSTDVAFESKLWKCFIALHNIVHCLSQKIAYCETLEIMWSPGKSLTIMVKVPQLLGPQLTLLCCNQVVT